MSDELRGSAPIYTAKEILQRIDERTESLDKKFDTLNIAVAILVDQKLNERLSVVEAWRNRIQGLALVSGVLAFVAMILEIVERV